MVSSVFEPAFLFDSVFCSSRLGGDVSFSEGKGSFSGGGDSFKLFILGSTAFGSTSGGGWSDLYVFLQDGF